MRFFNINIYFLIIAVMTATLSATAQIKDVEMATYARDLVYRNFNEIKSPKNIILVDKNQDQKYYIVNFIEGGHIMFTKIDGQYSIQSVAPKGQITLDNQHFFQNPSNAVVVDVHDLSLPTLQTNTAQQRSALSNVPVFLTSEWGSVNCIDDANNIVNVSNYYTPSNCSAGCVAISTSQVLHYFNWPKIGVGNNVYSDTYNGSLVRHGAFFDKENYDWANMLDRYMYVNSTDAQRRSVGKLVYDVAVAVKMNFEPSGSSSNVNKVPFILENFFRYGGSHYQSVSWSSYWSRLYQNMHERIPVPMAIEDSSNGAGHAMVACGYQVIDGNPCYYINWGWYNSGAMHNSWEYLQGWNSSRPNYDTVIGGIFDIMPEPQITEFTNTGTGNDFTVHWDVARNVNWEEFTLQMKVDNASIWQTVSSSITAQEYTITNPTGNVYQFRVKGKANGGYYLNSYSEAAICTVNGSYNGFAKFEGSQHAYARQTPGYDLVYNHDYTFETWIRVKNGNQNGDVILDQEQIFAWEIEDVTASDYSIVFKSPASLDALHSNASGAKLQNNQWYHIAVSTTGSTTKLFVNGIERDSNNANHFHLNSSNNNFNIGERFHSGYSGFIKADFDQMRWSNIGRYSTNFTPDQHIDFVVDNNTKAYFKFQDVHRRRFKDEAFHVSVIVENSPGNVRWNFDYYPAGMSVEEQELFSSNVLVYPNPTSDIITVTFKENDTYSIEDFTFKLFDISGKQLNIVPKVQDNLIKINLKNLSKGNYLLVAKSKDFTATKQIIKE